MGTIWVREFRGGLDTRRLPETLPGGALIFAQDCHITQGGQVEQRADFVPVWSAPEGSCVGLAADEDTLVVFGHEAIAPDGLPDNFAYQQLVHPDEGATALTSVPAWRTFGDDVAAVGVFEDGARFLYLDGAHVSDSNAPPQTGGVPRALGVAATKLFAGAGATMFFSDNLDGTDFTAEGAGAVGLSFYIGSGARVRAFEAYERWLAVFSERVITVWNVDADPDNFSLVQQLDGFGTFSSRTTAQFRGADVLFYDLSGIRSLRARDSSGVAQTADVGSPIDALTSAAAAEADETRRELAAAIIEPRTGRVWFAIGEYIFVLSHYDVTDVTAWSVYRPGFTIDGIAVLGDRVYVRSGDDFYVYGSESGPYQYSSDVHAEVWLPYLDADAPAKSKSLAGFDAAARGTWEVRLGYDPENLDATDLVARITGTTFWDPRMPVPQGSGTHLGLRFRSLAPLSSTEPAVLASAAIHYDLDDPEDSPGA